MGEESKWESLGLRRLGNEENCQRGGLVVYGNGSLRKGKEVEEDLIV